MPTRHLTPELSRAVGVGLNELLAAEADVSDNKIDVQARIDMTPELLASAFSGMDSDKQAAFYAELWRLADYKLCLQMAWVVNSISERDDHDAMNAFRTMADHAESYPEAAASWRAANAKAAIRQLSS